MQAIGPDVAAVASQHDEDPGGSPNPPQRRVYQHIVSHIESVIAHQAPARNPDPILMQVDGQGGTGKSFLISALVANLQQLRLRQGCVALTAPTGIAALNIGGATIYSLFRL
ncbi:hypothetical protein E4U60_007077 [Claviceps pazoutovae]|uniref:ATP-dependent DNA helicase n=1 Tax=Claviceps pazoutovae TaxID=1649127 RepID=A0A9P7MFT3_9HYPO|nr:hypothetical protein E4U60_007077 [Claviceps pazoutovae]